MPFFKVFFIKSFKRIDQAQPKWPKGAYCNYNLKRWLKKKDVLGFQMIEKLASLNDYDNQNQVNTWAIWESRERNPNIGATKLD